MIAPGDDPELAAYDYDLPPDRIAQRPPARRTDARLLILDRVTGDLEIGRVTRLPGALRPGDLLVRNVTRVFPARLLGHREPTGGSVEALLVRPADESGSGDEPWWALVRPGRRVRVGDRLRFAPDLSARVVDRDADGLRLLRFDPAAAPLLERVEHVGHIPLPPYIRRPDDERDRRRYQTVYATRTGSVAAPTAGLHLTPSLLARIRSKGVEVADLVLHVGPGTFRPVGPDGIAAHRMHAEPFELPESCAEAIERTRDRGGQVVAVGTTVVRVLEARAKEGGRVEPGRVETDLFIHPPFRFRVVDALLTNFHLPRSTLLMLVAAFAGRERVLGAYREAVRAGFRFYSYGDAMFIR